VSLHAARDSQLHVLVSARGTQYGVIHPSEMSSTMLKTLLFVAVLASLLVAPRAAHADESGAKPINLSLFTPIQIFDKDTSIHGFRFSLIYGVNREMHGFDLGLVNRATGSVVGLQWGIANWNESSLKGIQLGFLNHQGGETMGAQLGTINLQDAGTGFQWGLVNYSPVMKGLQLGLVNYAEHLEGLQIGLINIAKNGFLPVFVIVNFNFN
jgi:hypothetical protein